MLLITQKKKLKMVAQKVNIDKINKHIVCFSGGHSSAIVAIAVSERHGKENVVLLNHDINPSKEADDVKRFKKEISNYLDIPIRKETLDLLSRLIKKI